MLKNIKLDLLLFIRFLAALLVVRQHVDFPYPNINVFNFPIGWMFVGNNGSGGYAVILFFTISGYLMGKNFFSGKYTFNLISILNFYINRFKRIAPLYYFVTAYTLFYIFPYVFDWIRDDKKNIVILQKLLTFNYYGEYQFNVVYWALSIEVSFYIICPIIFYILHKIQPNKYITLFLFGLILAPNTQMSLVSLNKYHKLFEFVSYFILGSITYFIIKNINFKLFASKFLLYFSFTSALISLLFPWYLYKVYFINQTQLIISLSTCLFIYCYELNNQSKQPIYKEIDNQSIFLQTKRFIIYSLNYLGKLSYAIFLTHITFLFRINEIYQKALFLKYGPFYSGLILFFMTIFVTITVSSFLYHSVEIPGAKNIDSFVNMIKNYFIKIKQRLNVKATE